MTSRSTPRLVLVFALALLLPAASAMAQSTACVHLLVGSGYAAWMRVVSNNYSSDWSHSFAIGQTACQSLTSIGDGQPFTVQVSAVLGSSKVPCTPSNISRVASSNTTITFLASGTTLNVKCAMPSLDSSPASGTTVSKAGLKAAADIKKKEPPKPKD